MTYVDFGGELADKMELLAEEYWVNGMSLADARQMAAETLTPEDSDSLADRERH